MRYRIFTWADITACIIVIAVLLFVFIYPYCLSRDYYELFYDKQQRVLECTREENWGEAQKLMEAMAADFYVKRDSMRFFYDHEDIDEIEGYILSAQELILRILQRLRPHHIHNGDTARGKRTVRIRTYARAYSCRFP